MDSAHIFRVKESPGGFVYFFFTFQGCLVYVAHATGYLRNGDFTRLQARRCNASGLKEYLQDSIISPTVQETPPLIEATLIH